MKRQMRIWSVVFMVILIVEILHPTVVWALTSGPGQPEVEGFTPIGNKDMVDLFTGDMSYNIPLLDVEGYPVNLAYQAGPTMDQEASWVGLGWSLTPGAVERQMRGLPDDFKGDAIRREMNLRTNTTLDVMVSVGMDGLELFGFPASDNVNAVLTTSVGFRYNNYDGVSATVGLTPAFSSAQANKSEFSGGLGITSNSHEGLKLRPQFGYDRAFGKSASKLSGGLNVGIELDSRKGLTAMTFGANAQWSDTYDIPKKAKNSDGTNKIRGRHTHSLGHGASTRFERGQPTYTPELTLPMVNKSRSGSFKVGIGGSGLFSNATVGVGFSEQKLMVPVVTTPAYGYLFLQHGQTVKNGLLDFNRERNGPFSPDHAALPVPSLTPDIFVVTGQNVSGSYRPYRSEVGYVRDQRTSSTGSDGAVGGEAAIHIGLDLTVNSSNSWSGAWTDMNTPEQRLRYRDRSLSDPLAENVYFREANESVVEMDDYLYDQFQGDQPTRFRMTQAAGYNMRLNGELEAKDGSLSGVPQLNHRTKREPRAQLFTYLSHSEVRSELGLNGLVDRNVSGSTLSSPTAIPDHHMSEITVTGLDGSRSIYGIPAYNLFETSVTFAIDPSENPEGTTDLIYYDTEWAEGGHPLSRDHFCSRSTTPKYAHSFLLTAVLSADYSDVDAVRGPSRNDLGTYTKFNYDLAIPRYPWRTPASTTLQMARLDRGLGGTSDDDKASYVFGEKEIWYLSEIESRNLIAVFHRSERMDGIGIEEDGALSSTRLQKLDSISLFEIRDYQTNGDDATPIKRVHFEYRYLLCGSTPNSLAAGGYKLTLDKVYFTYGSSRKGVTSPYVFDYLHSVGDNNPSYGMEHQDRWGCYKQSNGPLTNTMFPYAEQDATTADSYAGVWSLRKIRLPSGGMIEVDYEADDYGFVQRKPAMRMFKLCGIGDAPSACDATSGLIEGVEDKNVVYFKIPEELEDYSAQDFLQDLTMVYFRTDFKLDDQAVIGRDHISGYAKVSGLQILTSCTGASGGKFGALEFEMVPLDAENTPCNVTSICKSPYYRAGLEFLRLNHEREITAPPGAYDENASLGETYLTALIDATMGLVTGLVELILRPNTELHIRNRFCKKMDAEKSWIRLYEPDGTKKGGGYRVKTVRFNDAWDAMVAGVYEKTYGQQYTYTGEDGRSSGVAAYEPMFGADENPWRQPSFPEDKDLLPLTPDPRAYQEHPFGESMFPGPSVGYARVVVRDLYPAHVDPHVHGTGYVVNEFYTARDFPVIHEYTGVDKRRRRSEMSPLTLLGFGLTENMHTSQGFVVETNDMHGKPKATYVYPETTPGTTPTPLSYVLYEYKSEVHGSAKRLNNDALTIDPNGTIRNATIGRHFEIVGDMREYETRSASAGVALNLDWIYMVAAPLPVFVPYPRLSLESTGYRSGVLVKKIHRFGILERVTSMTNGSVVSVENLAYDARTSAVLLTKTVNDHDDPVYNMKFPGYWHYDGMGPAYLNAGARYAELVLTNGVASGLVNADHVFKEGDELAMRPTGGGPYVRGWVAKVDPGQVEVMDPFGAVVNGTFDVKILRSGRRNMQGANMAEMTLLSDPLSGFGSNIFENILGVTVVEFDDKWRASCGCVANAQSLAALNPFRLNQRGVWRLKREHAWLTERTRSIYDNNSNIRRDGVYASFDPFYRLNSGAWMSDPSGWTMVREVTEYSDRGQELENKDALDLFSAATFGYGGSLPRSVARNSRLSETGFDGFEEGSSPVCTDRHFKFTAGPGQWVDGTAHSGRRSLRVGPTGSASITATVGNCDPVTCTLAIDEEGITGGTEITVTGGLAPYVVMPQVLSGAPSIAFAGANTLAITGSGWIIELYVQDAAGCERTFTVQP